MAFGKCKHDTVIFIPTFGRPEYVHRQICYWASLPYDVVILDGSDEELSVKTTSDNISYHHLPGCTIDDRLRYFVFKYGNKPYRYAIMLPDDEFYLPSAIDAARAILQNDSSVVSVLGRALAFNYDCELGEVFVDEVYSYLGEYNIDDDFPAHRLQRTIRPNKYGLLSIYSLARFQVFLKALLFSSSKIGGAPAEGQFRCEFVYRTSGKVVSIPRLMWLRSAENPPIWKENSSLSFSKWLMDYHFRDEREEFKSELRAFLVQEGFQGGDASCMVDMTIKAYEKSNESKTKCTAMHKVGKSLFRRLLRNLSDFDNKHKWHGQLSIHAIPLSNYIKCIDQKDEENDLFRINSLVRSSMWRNDA